MEIHPGIQTASKPTPESKRCCVQWRNGARFALNPISREFLRAEYRMTDILPRSIVLAFSAERTPDNMFFHPLPPIAYPLKFPYGTKIPTSMADIQGVSARAFEFAIHVSRPSLTSRDFLLQRDGLSFLR